MDEDVRNLLRQWDLDDYVSTFEINKITLNILPLLTNDLARDLMYPIGDEANFFVWKALPSNEKSDEAGASDPVTVGCLKIRDTWKHNMVDEI